MSAISGYTPTEGYILCTAETEPDKTPSGLFIPDNAKAPLTQGVVLQAGSMCDQELFSKGRLIIFRLHTESRVSIGGQMYIIVEPNNVLLVGPILKETTDEGESFSLLKRIK